MLGILLITLSLLGPQWYVIAEEDDHELASISGYDDFEHNCDEPPPPLNGELLCGKHKKKADRYVCKAQCDPGYQFPSKKPKLRRYCDLNTGEWSPKFEFPDCDPICSPPCENNGKCSEGNHCICTPKYRGDRCQYAVELCDPERGLGVSAEWKCDDGAEETTCVMKCPQGTRYESPPADMYHCTLAGTWTPSFAPNCIPINVIEPPAANGMYSPVTNQLTSSGLPTSGVCAMWGTSHYRTFDGGIYSFQGPCTYVLAKDCAQNSFAIHIQNPGPCESAASCSTTLAIYIGSEKYLLTRGKGGGPVVEKGDEVHPVPGEVQGLLFQLLSDYVTVKSSLGFSLKWNQKNTVLVKASPQLRNRTCGLCGKFDGSVLNDFETSDGSITDSVQGFVNSWTMDDLGERCEQKAIVRDTCSEDKAKAIEAEALCSDILDIKFSACHELVDPKIYLEVCKMEHCACPFGSCYCGTLAEYFRECSRLGGKIDGGWRSDQLCPLSCPEGMIYKDCGSSCPRTCKGTLYDCEDNQCLDGCHCPEGMLLHDGRCIEHRECPCMHAGKEYPTGDTYKDGCNTCECNGGEWQCTNEKCEATCSSSGDPHYTTFDGLKYDLYGNCSYYLVYNDNFTIVQEIGPCHDTSEPATDGMYCTSKLAVKYEDESLVLHPGFKVTLNEKDANLPVSADRISASMATDLFLKVDLLNGLNVLWDGQNRIYVNAPPTLYEQTAGLCGTFNGKQMDDFTTPNRDIEADASSFAARWEVSGSCHKRSRRRSGHLPCESQPQKLKDAELLCSTLKLDIFKDCHEELDPTSYFKSCISDLCQCTQELELCLCPIIADYSLACTKKGIVVNWVEDITVCKPECSGGQVYQECRDPCTSSCAAIASSSDTCIQQCVQGCACVEGTATNAEGFCVAVDQCPCIYEDKEYLPASVTVQGSNVCTCQAARWQCRPGTLPELASLSSDFMIEDSDLKCSEDNNEEYTQCKESCPRTCQNMHLRAECKTEECRPGCKCREGYLLDSELKKCVKESECGCVHGNKRYKEGETIKQTCNLCTCSGGSWQCTMRECPGVCSVWGESHFKTFDGKIFDFQGDCEYVLSNGKTKDASYSLSVQNVPCGTSGITCSKSFTLELGPLRADRGDTDEMIGEAETLQLSRDEPVPRTSLRSRFVVVESGLFVTVFTDIGLSLQWDRGTRIYITAQPRWRSRVKGLCGNFNDNQEDDFLTPSGGIPEATSSIFAESWKVHEFCPRPQTIEDACEIHPHRKSWAQQKCGILKAEAFSACHSEVPMEPYYERCVFDSCACDMGGDCECLCTAIAAYAQECNMHGVSVKWRSQELCPMQCEECATYDSCMPSCPKRTCENGLTYERIEEACSAEFCVEGCNPKPCPEGQVYNNGKEFKCIPEIQCIVPCMELNGKIYNEGDRITDAQVVDACQTCHCVRGSIRCSGPPCADTEPLQPCLEGGWTPWVNTPSFVGGDYEVLTDPRLKSVLQNYCGIANMTQIECRVAETKQPYTETGQRVQCGLPTGLSCKDEDQKDAPCEDYEIRVFCDCGPIPTTEATTVAVTTMATLPPVCDQTGWTAWMSGNVPNEQGEFETLDRLRVNHYFCEESMIENVECRTRSSWQLVTGEDEDVICNSKVGLVCLGSGCEDYEVRVFCNCGVETTPAPVPVCVTGWSEYFNTDHPDVSETGDDESLDRIRSLREFCVGGTIEDIECKAIINDQLVDYKELDTFGLKCSKNVGFECNQFVRPKKCEDFTVRFYCACEPIPVKQPTTPTTTTTTPAPVTITPVPVECGWTPWINMDSPDFEEGDIEDLSKIQMLYKTCGGKDLIDIECRMARTQHKYSDSLQNNLICDTERGFRCLNDDQTGKCYDYEIRLLCMYSWCYPPTTTPVPTTTTINPCGEGKVYDKCAFHCGQVCSSLSYKLSEECLHAQDGCVPGCRPVEGCEPPHLWRDFYTCVAKEDCFCTMQDENGTIMTIPPNEVIINGCEKCQCLENDMICHQIPGCGITEEIAVPRLLIHDIVQEDCWTSWINLDKPDRGGGDLEVPSRIRNVYEFCQDPIKIECRTAISHQKPFDVGQIVTCDLHDGLICWNKDNKPEECYDYEIRFFCPCPSQTTTTVAPLPTLPPAPCVFGWTEWYNNHAPDGRGDYETVQSSRISHSFCSNDMISAMQCRQVGRTEGDLQAGVTCDLDFGLLCNSELLYGSEQCSDYEIRFFCDCPTMAPATEMETLPPITTQAPVHLACAYWSEWINENHPSSGGGGVKGGKGVKGGAGSRGDTEKVMILRLKRDYDFCLEGYLSDIECRDAETDLHYTETEDKKLACSLAGGFRCRGRDQPSHRCRDYKIRYFCSCETSTTPTTVKPTTPEITVPPCNEFYRVVDGPAPLPDSRLRASSSRDTSSGPQSARLSSEDGPRSAGAWIAGKHNDMQFLEFDLGKIQPVYGVVTKGRNGHLEWVKSYKVLYSRDGDAYHYIQDQNKDKIFSGNYDSDSEVQHLFLRPFDARFVRIQPVTFYKAIAMRADILGCASDMEEVIITTTGPPPCNDEMGMWNGNIRDYQISTSSNRNWSTDGRYARLNTLQTEDHSGGWVADHLDNKQYIQVNFMEPRNLTGVKTQGRDMVPQWVTAFYISYSQDGEKWNKIKDQDGTTIFPGNYDSSTTAITYFPRPIRARFLRIHPVFWENWIAMRFEVLGCYEQIEEEVKDDLQSTPKPIIVSEVCTEPMGFENYALPDTLIAVSSSDGPFTGASRIRLNTHQEGLLSGGWIPANYDYMPRVYIDFYEVRNLTGIITQGLEEADRWVISYKVAYSLDNVTWDFATEKEYGDIVFSGNVDRNGEVLRLFDRMITARFLEIIILDYHNLPALRMEVLGCFIPYPVYTPPPVLQTTTEICVEYGPWISLSDPASSEYGDEEPIEQVIAASGLCRNPFEIECRTQVTKKDYSETGQVVSCDLSRGLFCKNAHQPSYQCYNYEVRIKCWTCGVTEVTTPVPLVLCPEIPDTFISSCPESCPPDFACDGAACVPAIDCPCFRDGKRFQPSNVAITGDCQHCECVIGGYSRCEPINCPDCLPGQKPEMDSTCHCGCVGCAFGTVLCPTSGECIGEEQWCDGVQDCPDDETGCPTLPPTTTVLPTTTTEAPIICSTDFVPDTSTCEMLSNVFETFDGVTYQYDICDHVLMKETSSGLYSVSVHKSCVPFCQRHLVIEVDGIVVKIGPGVEDVTVQDTRVPPANLYLVSRRFPDFEIKKNGNTIVFRSFKHNFDVTWDSVQDAKITVSKCLLYSLSGLCGLYNKRSEDDLTKSNGAIASSSQEFGDSWAIGSLEKCVPSKCPPDVMRTAIEVCSKLREDPFNYSCSSYMKMDNRIEACTTFMCECMQQDQQYGKSSTADVTPSKDVLYDFLGAQTCKCRAYESFVEACEAVRQRPVQEWRINHDCSPNCPEGMEWQDCGPGCELTCDNYHQRSEVCGSACVPGCYCPDGLVRHHNRCVKPKMCQDCVCRGHGDPNYISFDGQYYAFQGICTYVLVQHQGSDDNPLLNFRILATNVECPEEPHTSCTHGLTIYWNGHVIEKFKNKPVFFNEKPLRAEDSPLEYGGISISYVPNKSTLIHIKEINLAVRYFDQMYGFNVELPAFFYFNKTEGLCGICNFIQSDDMYHREGYVTENVDDFAYSWLEGREESRETCELTRVPVPEPPPPGICNFTASPCDVFLDPTLYSKSCQNDVTYSQRPEASVCRSKFQYAQQCCERGVDLVEWLKLSGCESTCPEGMIYECSSACSKTCDNYKNYRLDDCSLQPLYTCACPEGKVLKLGQCVDEIQCETCDAQGHVVGEVWREGPCKTCECLPDLTVNCVVVECPLPPACNDKETLQRVNRSEEECCDAYLCMPMAEKTCPEAPLEECPPGQAYVKDYIDGCPVYSCKCIKELCPPLMTPLLDDGENYTVIEVDCCRQYKILCNPESCLPPPACSPGFKVSTYEGRCCYKYTCVPRNDVCVYQHKYDVVNGTQVHLPLEEVAEVEYEPGSSWQDGLCRKCSCVEMNGQFTYSCREEVCPNPNEFPDAEKYYREEIHIPGACCSKFKRTACVVHGVKYEIGEEWASPDGNPCKSYRCNLDKNGEAVRLEKTTICDTTCPQYAVYVEAAPESGKCCGVCKPIACEEDGTLYENGETWVSTSKPCFTAECLVTENGTRITYRGESCPIMPDNCAPENVRSDSKGCCTYCKIPTETCSAVEVPVYETRGLFGYVDKRRGYCSNEQVLRGLTKCGGQCTTESHYSDLVGDFHSVCNCCLPKQSQNRTIVLDCEDGSKVDKVYMQPITCQCLSCSGNNRYLDALNKVEPYRK